MTLIYFLLMLSFIIFVHELGHFLFSRLFNVHIYEFSLGMGPRFFVHKSKKSSTEYSLRLFPIGGYVRIAGEDDNDDDDIPSKLKLTSKTWVQKFIVMGAGSLFNFISAIIIIFVLAMTLGSVSTKPYIGEAIKDYPAYEAGLRDKDLVLSINDRSIKSYDELVIELYKIGDNKTKFEVQSTNGSIKTYYIEPTKEKDSFVYGIRPSIEKHYGIINSIEYTSYKFVALIKTMSMSIASLITGGININQFSGPIGVYDMVGDQAQAGIGNLLYFMAYLSINIGFINLLPLPAIDGGKIFFLTIEGITRRKVNPSFENLVHTIGFFLLIGLMILITFNDIFRIGG